MYIGDPHDGSGLHHLLWEVLANSLDQFLMGKATRIDVALHADESIEVTDDGPGIPMGPTDHGPPFVEWVLTSLHHSATADGHAPHVHVGIHGVGLAAVCALSENLTVELRGARGRYRQTFARGAAVTELTRVGDPSRSGTSIRLKPDPDIFSTRWNVATIDQRLRELSALQPGLLTSFRSTQRHGPSDLRDLLDSRNSVLPEPFLCVRKENQMTVRIALDWNGFDGPEDEPTILQFSNLEATRDGDHMTGFKRGLAGAFARLGAGHGKAWVRPFEILSRGLSAVVSVSLIDPEYGDPTRDLLVHPRIGKLVERTLVDELPPLMNHIPDFRDDLLSRLRDA